MEIKDNIISVPKGYLIKRLSDGALLGREYGIGYTYYMNGRKLEEPYLEQFADFCEVKETDVASDEQFKKEVPVDKSEGIPVIEETPKEDTVTKSLAELLKQSLENQNALSEMIKEQQKTIDELKSSIAGEQEV